MVKIKSYLKPRARIIKTLGQELISSGIIALVELVKNAYDADATEVKIFFKDIFTKNGEIIIEDNGIGMSSNKIVDVWMEPATPDKISSDGKGSLTCYFKRKCLGSKGIGRFAAHRLGDKICLISRATNDYFKNFLNHETTVKIDWSNFTEDKYLNEIPIFIEENLPEKFTKASGTYIKISHMDAWKRNEFRWAISKLRSLESPLKDKEAKNQKNIKSNKKKDPGFTITISSNNTEAQSIIEEIRPISEILEDSFYRFTGTIDEKGILNYDYEFNRPDYPNLKREEKNKKTDLKRFLGEFIDELRKNGKNIYQVMPGKFEINFYVWDLDSTALKIAGLTTIYNQVIKTNGGVRIYRDGFRVWPYGEDDDDWLGLDLKRLNAPKERLVSRNQIIGFVRISLRYNPNLIDQSNREGLQRNPEYETFYTLVGASLKYFANLRKVDKINIEKITKKASWEDKVTQEINKIRFKIKKNKHEKFYTKNVNSIEASYHEQINEILERYMLAASLGISYTLPSHEMKIRFKTINGIIKDMEKSPKMQEEYLRRLISVIKDTENIVNAVTSVMSRQKEEKIDLKNLIAAAKVLKQRELEKYDIKLKLKIEKNASIKVRSSLIKTAIINLIDNSIYWIRIKRNEMLEIGKFLKGEIKVEAGINNKNKPYIRIKDNGTGIIDPIELLVEPSYSRKSDGQGLGLYLVNEIIKRHGGHLNAYNEEGAVFELIFDVYGD